MADVLSIAAKIGTPVALLAFIAALLYFAYSRRMRYETNKLASLPPEERASRTDEYLTRYGINASDLPAAKRYQLIRDEMSHRFRRSLTFLVVAAVILVSISALWFFAPSKNSPATPAVAAPNANQSLLAFVDDARDVTINYHIPDSATREAIVLLEKKAADHESSVALTRNELQVLSNALRDLDQRTSGIVKLPDGRTKVGDIISGNPIVVIDAVDAGRRLLTAGNAKDALHSFEVAIRTYDEAAKVTSVAQSGVLTPQFLGSIYVGASISAGLIGQWELAYSHATKAVATNPAAGPQAILAHSLFNLGKVSEAKAMIEKAIELEPSNLAIHEMKRVIFAP